MKIRLILHYIGGVILLLFGYLLNSWTESHAIQSTKLATGIINVPKIIDAQTPLPENDGKLVYVSGKLNAQSPLKDDELAISVAALRLKRTVAMQQWREFERIRKTDYGNVTHFSYGKVWSTQLIDSSRFHFTGSISYQNPGQFFLSSKHIEAQKPMLGGFQISDTLLKRVKNYTPLALDKASIARLKTTLSRPVHQYKQGIYLGSDPANPVIGDIQVKYDIVKPQLVSIIAMQQGNRFVPYSGGELKQLEILSLGKQDPMSMLGIMPGISSSQVWLFRLVFLLLLVTGFYSLLPLPKVFFKRIPGLRNLCEHGKIFQTAFFSLSTGGIAMALSWLSFHSVLSTLFLLLIGIGVFFTLQGKFLNERNTQ